MKRPRTGGSDWKSSEEGTGRDGGEALRFIASTDRARAEVTLAAGQLRLADSFIARLTQ